jgi:hypothetical protein
MVAAVALGGQIPTLPLASRGGFYGRTPGMVKAESATDLFQSSGVEPNASSLLLAAGRGEAREIRPSSGVVLRRAGPLRWALME